MTKTDLEILTRLVADLEILFTPWRYTRDSSASAFSACRERQKRYLAGRGIEFAIGGAPAARQAGRKTLAKLAGAGIIALHSDAPNRQSASVLRLDGALRATDNTPLAASWPFLASLAALHDDPRVLRNGWDFIAEQDVWGTTDGRVVVGKEAGYWPLIAAGLVMTASDACGSVGWMLTSRGFAALEAGCPVADPIPGAKRTAALDDMYNRLVLRGLKDREKWEPSIRGDLGVPLSCGTWERRTVDKSRRDREWCVQYGG